MVEVAEVETGMMRGKVEGVKDSEVVVLVLMVSVVMISLVKKMLSVELIVAEMRKTMLMLFG